MSSERSSRVLATHLAPEAPPTDPVPAKPVPTEPPPQREPVRRSEPEPFEPDWPDERPTPQPKARSTRDRRIAERPHGR